MVATSTKEWQVVILPMNVIDVPHVYKGNSFDLKGKASLPFQQESLQSHNKTNQANSLC